MTNYTIATEQTLSLLAHLRIKADLELLPKYPYFFGKPYPLGRCCEIRDAVFEQLKVVLNDGNNSEAATLRAYLAQGHSVNKIWGSLRGLYFQNALQIGDFYVDCANDTVNPNKPRIEILPMAESGFKYITNFEDYAKIAESYWEVRIYKNTVCTSLAPYFPILFLDKKNKSWLASNNYLFDIVKKSSFEESERIIAKLPEIGIEHKVRWTERLKQQESTELLNNKHSAEDYCKIYRDLSLHEDNSFRDKIVGAFTQVSSPV